MPDPMMLQRRTVPLWRWLLWGSAAALLLLPAIAMHYTDEVRWEAASFVVMGLMLATLCGLVELGLYLGCHWAYRLGFALAALTGFATVWINLAVGMIGAEGDPRNLMFIGVLLVAATGAGFARFRAPGLATTMFATAAAMAATVVYAAATGHALEARLLLLWVVAWAMAGALFRIAARAGASARGG